MEKWECEFIFGPKSFSEKSQTYEDTRRGKPEVSLDSRLQAY